MAITLLGHPSGAREVAFERSPRAVGVAVRVNMQDDPRDIAPVGTVRIGIEQAQIRDEMLLVVGGNRWIGRGQISDIRIASSWVFLRRGYDTQHTTSATASGQA